MTSTGDNNELERTGRATSQARPLRCLAGTFSQPKREITLRWPCNSSNLTHPHSSRPVLNGSKSAQLTQKNEQQNYNALESYSASGLRGTSPPAEATSNIS
jgi:hypothetical protein